MIEIENIKFSFGADFSLDIDRLFFPEGRITVVIGPNGSGKSTLMRIMAGFNRDFKGTLKICGHNAQALDVNRMARAVSYVGTRPDVLPDMCVFDVAATGRYPYTGGLGVLNTESINAVDKALIQTGLAEKKYKKLSSLSSGEAQRVMIARSIAQDTPVLLMDESTSNLDPKYAHDIINILKNLKKNKTIVMVMHDINTALDIADSLVGIKNGRICFVTENVAGVSADVMSELFDVGFCMHSFENKKFIGFK